MKKAINAKSYEKDGLINKVMEFVNKTRNLCMESKIHAVKSILYKEYNINVSYKVLEERFKKNYR